MLSLEGFYTRLPLKHSTLSLEKKKMTKCEIFKGESIAMHGIYLVWFCERTLQGEKKRANEGGIFLY